MTRARVAVLTAMACVVACSSQRVGRTPQPDGSYKLECQKPLADCLTDLTTDICREYGYDVLRGKEAVARNGVEPVNSVIVTSEVVVKCRSSGALLGGTPEPRPTASAAPAHTGCFPGATQACLGPGACRGAQTCRDDGAKFGACDCGGAAPAPAPSASAAPPSTWATPPADAGVAP